MLHTQTPEQIYSHTFIMTCGEVRSVGAFFWVTYISHTIERECAQRFFRNKIRTHTQTHTYAEIYNIHTERLMYTYWMW